MAIGIAAQRVNAKLEFDRAMKRSTNHKIVNEFLDGVLTRKDGEQCYKAKADRYGQELEFRVALGFNTQFRSAGSEV